MSLTMLRLVIEIEAQRGGEKLGSTLSVSISGSLESCSGYASLDGKSYTTNGSFEDVVAACANHIKISLAEAANADTLAEAQASTEEAAAPAAEEAPVDAAAEAAPVES